MIFCRQAATINKIKINTDVYQERDFIPIGVACKSISSLLDINKGWNNFSDILNLGSMKSFTIMGMAELVSIRAEKILNFKPMMTWLLLRSSVIKD